MTEFRSALRQFAKSPGFAATVIVTISLGIGANTAIFTLVHAILLRSLPVADPVSLYRIGDLDDCCVNGGFINDNGDFDLFSYDLYREIHNNTSEFEQLAAFQAGQNMMNVRVGTNLAKSERTEYVSGNYFSTFGVGAYAGRMLQSSDDVPGRDFFMAESRSLYPNSITVQYAGDAASLESMARPALANINPDLTMVGFRSLDDQVAGNFNEERLISRLTGLFGVLALILASVGLYGITAYSVARRTNEIGVRMALGASHGNVVTMVMRRALALVAIGLAIGIPIALLGGRLMRSQLYGVNTYDPLTLTGAVLVLAASAALAGFIPARRAASIEPMHALRTE